MFEVGDRAKTSLRYCDAASTTCATKEELFSSADLGAIGPVRIARMVPNFAFANPSISFGIAPKI